MKTTIKSFHRTLLGSAVGVLLATTPLYAADHDAKESTLKPHEPVNAAKLYYDNCASCHGADYGGFIAPALNAATLKGRSPTSLRTLLMTGSFDTLMPPFYGKLSDTDIRALVQHIQTSPKTVNPPWTINDMKASLKIYEDEKTLPTKPTFQIDNIDNIIGGGSTG
jgi:nitrite reductase (NO-forming) / hydroxylamine reductase